MSSIDIKLLANLKHCGYTRTESAQALIVTDNDFDKALSILASNSLSKFVNSDGCEKLVAMGYTRELAELSLRVFDSNILRAVEFFTANKNEYDLKGILEAMVIGGNIAGTSKALVNDGEKVKNALKVYEDMTEEMNKDDEAYLDLNLNEDSFFIEKYYSMLKKS